MLLILIPFPLRPQYGLAFLPCVRLHQRRRGPDALARHFSSADQQDQNGKGKGQHVQQVRRDAQRLESVL
jgi:hypothetical protein